MGGTRPTCPRVESDLIKKFKLKANEIEHSYLHTQVNIVQLITEPCLFDDRTKNIKAKMMKIKLEVYLETTWFKTCRPKLHPRPMSELQGGGPG